MSDTVDNWYWRFLWNTDRFNLSALFNEVFNQSRLIRRIEQTKILKKIDRLDQGLNPGY